VLLGLAKAATRGAVVKKRGVSAPPVGGSVDDAEDEDDAEEEAERLLEELMLQQGFDADPPAATAAASETQSRVLFPATPTQKRAPAAGGVGVACQPTTTTEKAAEEAEMDRWCCICNDDAVCWCNGCDGDAFCRRCFSEGHQDEDMRGHSTVPIRRRRG